VLCEGIERSRVAAVSVPEGADIGLEAVRREIEHQRAVRLGLVAGEIAEERARDAAEERAEERAEDRPDHRNGREQDGLALRIKEYRFVGIGLTYR
jgi:hypothetical protein